ncbi:MAG: DUF721 domain-containing protein [Planctomycetes bacterium]|nr:DUF721 domain-containing protein [Planctomycetota bacterium]
MSGRGRTRREPVSLREAMHGFLRESGLALKLEHAQVYRAWSDALGERLARRARPVRFQFGELAVEVESSTHLHELQNFTGEAFRAEANRRLGDERIKKVVYHLKR